MKIRIKKKTGHQLSQTSNAHLSVVVVVVVISLQCLPKNLKRRGSQTVQYLANKITLSTHIYQQTALSP